MMEDNSNNNTKLNYEKSIINNSIRSDGHDGDVDNSHYHNNNNINEGESGKGKTWRTLLAKNVITVKRKPKKRSEVVVVEQRQPDMEDNDNEESNLDGQKQEVNALKELGLESVGQLELEANLLTQVNETLLVREEEQDRRRLEKLQRDWGTLKRRGEKLMEQERKRVCGNELAIMTTATTTDEETNSKDIDWRVAFERDIEQLEEQEELLHQRMREREMIIKRGGTLELANESDRDRLIRTGKWTPFTGIQGIDKKQVVQFPSMSTGRNSQLSGMMTTTTDSNIKQRVHQQLIETPSDFQELEERLESKRIQRFDRSLIKEEDTDEQSSLTRQNSFQSHRIRTKKIEHEADDDDATVRNDIWLDKPFPNDHDEDVNKVAGPGEKDNAARQPIFTDNNRNDENDHSRDLDDDDNDINDEAEDEVDVTTSVYDQDDGDETYYESRYRQWAMERRRNRLRRNVAMGTAAAAAGKRYLERMSMESTEIPITDRDNEEEYVHTEEDTLFEGDYGLPYDIARNLLDYQKTGIRWLWELHCQRVGGIMGDEMGLGKTVQMISFLAGLKYNRLLEGPVLIVCPATLLRQWVREFHRWWPPFRVAILHSSGSFTGPEDAIIDQIVHRQDHVLVTTYGTLRVNRSKLLPLEWSYAILDEGHKIRNPDADITLVCKQLKTSHRIILSGSPIQNSLKELWSLFDFVFPGKLGTLPVFQNEFAIPIALGGYVNASTPQVLTAYKCACVLRDLIAPYLLRRLKSDVAADLPKKHEHVLFCKLTTCQRRVYESFLQSTELQEIFDGHRQIFYGLDILKKICNHPDLLRIHQAHQLTDYGKPVRSGKMQVLDALFPLWLHQKHRVLLFCQTRQMLDICETYVKSKHYSYLRMDGTTPVRSRMSFVDEFNGNPEIFVFLLTTKVGGLGINLVGADRVLIFDPDWNPSTDIQARERVWRFGQTKEVTIYRLMTTGTIEEKIYHRQIFKQFLTNKILRDPRQRRFFKSNDLKDLFSLAPEHQKSTETAEIFAGLDLGIGNDGNSNNNNDKAPDGDAYEKRILETQAISMEGMITPIQRESTIETLTNSYQTIGLESHRNERRDNRTESPSTSKVESSSFPRLDSTTFVPVTTNDHRRINDDVGIYHRDDSPKVTGETAMLQSLFDKMGGGLHSTLQHEAIMNASLPEYSILERDASRIAQHAIQTLRLSTARRLKEAIDVPTWTGKSGTAGAPLSTRRPIVDSSGSSGTGSVSTGSSRVERFGTKPNPLFRSKTMTTPTESSSSSSSDLPHNRAGLSILSSSHPTITTPPSSKSILSHLRGDKPSSSSSYETDELLHNNNHLIHQIQQFLSSRGGQGTTHEVINHFHLRLNQQQIPLFRKLLRSIAEFHRDQNFVGVWRLKSEFV